MKLKRINQSFLLLSACCTYGAYYSTLAHAGDVSFGECPTEAFLIQNPTGTPIAFGVNIDLGSYRVMPSTLGSAKINGIGFSEHDRFIYGWDYGVDGQSGTLSRIDANFDITRLDITLASGAPTRFYVGDVSLTENAWYGYRPGNGLFRIDLDTLEMTQVAAPAQFSKPNIHDFAFHPDENNNLAYSLDADGYLWQIDVVAGSATRLNQVLSEAELGFTFVFGAIYFDVDGYLYASNNSNGFIFKVTLTNPHTPGTSDYASWQPSAILTAYGPSSNSNDGARCASAPVEAAPLTDFGDAPDSYQTTYDQSGARHGIGALEDTSSLRLGDIVDGETEGNPPPYSDDTSDNVNDDDGIEFPVPIQVGDTSMVQVTVNGATADSVLNAWMDFDRDGTFEADEIIISDLSVSDGTQSVFFDVPTWAVSGDSWSRFRISNTSGIGPTGGVPEGEVEDYAIDITESGVTTEAYPIGGAYTTFAYEDQYPIQGDYDMNDVLMNVKYTEYHLDNQVIRLKIEGQIAALGGDNHSGFAIRLQDIAREDIKQDSIVLTVNGETQATTVLEEGTTDAVFIIHEDLWDITEAGEAENCTMFRTQINCGTSYRPSWTLHFSFANAPATSVMPDFPYDPFIFAAPGHYYGDIGYELTGGYPGRGLEIHLKNNPPTAKFDSRYLSLGDDAASGNTHYHTTNGLPWAIEIPLNWQHPLEQVTILEAYPKFGDFSQDSQGQTETLWYMEANNNKIYID